MKKLKLKLNLKKIFGYLFVILVSGIFLTIILISLPLTEKILPNVTYNLNTKDSTYWSKQYRIKLDTIDDSKINEFRNILVRRLNTFGVEEVSTYVDTNENVKTMTIIVKSTQDKDLVGELIKNKFDVQILTRKSDVNFEDTENPYAYIFAKNYDNTEWSRDDFRNVYISNLKSSSGTHTYFAIFKPWTTNWDKFQNFLTQYENQYIGVGIDGFVTPLQIPTGTNKVFAVPLNTTEALKVQAIDILYNSGTIDLSYTVDSEKELAVTYNNLDYIKITIGLFVAVILAYVLLIIQKNTSKPLLAKSFLATVLTLAIYISFLKLFKIPIDSFMLLLEGSLAIILAKVLSENKDSILYIEIMLFIILAVITFLGIGYQTIFARDLLIILVCTKLSLVISGFYINKIKEYLQ